MNLIRKYDENHLNQQRQQRQQSTNRCFFDKSIKRDKSRKTILNIIVEFSTKTFKSVFHHQHHRHRFRRRQKKFVVQFVCY